MGNLMIQETGNAGAAISSAIQDTTGQSNISLHELLPQWGTAVLLSSDNSPEPPIRLNADGWILDTSASRALDLGSINHFNYVRTGRSSIGPVIYDAATYGSVATLEGTSVQYYQLASDATGVVEAAVLLPAGATLSVVVK